MIVGADVVLYEDADFEKIVHRINIVKVAKFSISPSNTPYHILCYMPGNYILLHSFNFEPYKSVRIVWRYLHVESTEFLPSSI